MKSRKNVSFSSDIEDPSLGVTDGGFLGRGLPSHGSLVDDKELVVLVVDHQGSFVKEEALVKLQSVIC